MDINLDCDLCGHSATVTEASAAQIEFVFDLYHKNHGHSINELYTYMWANGVHPAGEALKYPGTDTPVDDDDEDKGDVEP